MTSQVHGLRGFFLIYSFLSYYFCNFAHLKDEMAFTSFTDLQLSS